MNPILIQYLVQLQNNFHYEIYHDTIRSDGFPRNIFIKGNSESKHNICSVIAKEIESKIAEIKDTEIKDAEDADGWGYCNMTVSVKFYDEDDYFHYDLLSDCKLFDETQCLHEYLRSAGATKYYKAYRKACTYEEKINRHWRNVYYLDSCNNMQPLPPYKPIWADGRELFIHEEMLATMDVEEIVNLILKLYETDNDSLA